MNVFWRENVCSYKFFLDFKFPVGYAQDQIRMYWKDASSNPPVEPLRVNPDISLSEYYLSISIADFHPISVNSESGTLRCLVVLQMDLPSKISFRSDTVF